MAVTPRSAFRTTGNTDVRSFDKALARTIGGPSPMSNEAIAIYNILQPYGLTRLAAAMCWIERRNETDPGGLRYYGRDLHNAWAIKRNGKWARYDSYADAAADWADRILGPTYEDATSLADFIAIYAPSTDGNDPNAYAKMAANEINALPQEVIIEPLPEPDEPDPGDGPLDPWRPYPYPPMVDLIVPKPAEGAGFTRCAFRRPLIQAFGTHITDGPPSQTLEYLRDFFGTGGARQWDALTDLGISYDGRCGLFNDWRDPERGGTRAGWANGWGNDGPGFENGGQEFYRRFPDINVVIVSCEHFQKAGGQWSDAMIDTTIEVRTALAQEKKIPAASYPIDPRTGLSVEQQHRNFARKSCPAEPYISTYEPIIIAEVKRKLAAWQGGDVEIPAPEPVKTYTEWGLSREQVAHEFGILTRHNADGTVDELPFDPSPTGAISLAWLNRCEREGVFPEAEELRLWDSNIRPGQEWWASFESGWRLIRAAGDTRDAWRWLDQMEAA